jgi:hypothetical protein
MGRPTIPLWLPPSLAGRICDSVHPWGHIERRRVAPESKYLGFIPKAGLRDQAEIPRLRSG